MYKPSEKFLGVWVTAPILSKHGAVMGHTTHLEALVPIETGELSHTYHSAPHRVLGHAHAIDGNGNGPFNLITVKFAPVFVGWTRDGGKSFITEDDLVAERTVTTSVEVLRKLHFPGA